MFPITIILPVYNGMQYLEKSVMSVLNQQFTDFELLIIDDCSTDGSWEYLTKLKDKRVTLFRNEKNSGLFFNLNFLIKKSASPIIKLWSQDDVMYPDCLKEVISFHMLHLEIGFSYTDRDYIYKDVTILNFERNDATPEIVSPSLHARIAFITGSIAGNISNVAINRRVLDNVGLFNEGMKISGDFEMWVRLAKDHPVGFIKKRLIQLRNHNQQLSGQEKYFIFHLREDIEVYKILFSYISKEEQAEGVRLLRNSKLLFYYTLMLKAVLKGRFMTGYNFLKLLSSFDNFFIVTGHYFKNKVIYRKFYTKVL